MREEQRRVAEKEWRERVMNRVQCIREEMASGVRFLGGPGTAKEQNWKAARITGLSQTIIERLRWKKIKRIPADIVDCVRESVERHEIQGLARAKQEILIARQQAALMAERLAQVDPDFYGAEIDILRQRSSGDWNKND